MRLIDADELMELLRLRKDSGIGTEIDEIKTVEAIPIEWIYKWILTWTPDLPVSEMLKDWEKENEI